MKDITHTTNKSRTSAFLSAGFRPFFSAAILFSLIAMLIWTLSYSVHINPGLHHLSPLHWHAHEMIYGYGLAVVAGFLLTAVSNWTGRKTLRGLPLLGLLCCWLGARLVPFLPLADGINIMFALDSLFGLILLLALSLTIFRARQWQQLGILSKLLLLIIGNAIFYLGALGKLQQGIPWGLLAGLYLLLALILMMARRVIPFFIEKACKLSYSLPNYRWLDLSSMLLFLCFMISDIVRTDNWSVMLLSACLLVLHSIRLYHWHVSAIWTMPLLWTLFIAYGFIILGFALKIMSGFELIPTFLALHAFAVGGIGVMTLGMIARVSWAHTGRRIDTPPKQLSWLFLLIIGAAMIRVLLPAIDMQHYAIWVGMSQVLWLSAFSGLALIYLPILIRMDDAADQ